MGLADVVGSAFGWVASTAIDVENGRAWPEDGVPFDDLYSGTAGVLLACTEATRAGFDVSSLAADARARLVHLADRRDDVSTMPDDSLFGGWAGVAVALRAWSRVVDDAEATAAAARVTGGIAGRVLQSADDPARYTDVISGDAGILLALLDHESASAVRAAHLLADRLVRRAEPAPGGVQWRMVDGWPSLMPGFSHGTAGVAYALAAAGHALSRADLLDAAIRGAETLIAVGDHADGWAVPLQIPPRPDRPPVYYGWCHGPAGTGRLFLLLDAVDPQPRWRHCVDACLRALRVSGLPARRYPGFWDNVARCCGTAGVGRFALDCYQQTRDPALLDWVDTLAADVVGRAVTTPHGLTWSNTEHTADPPELPPQPGLMQGAAGIAGWLAGLDAAHGGRDVVPTGTPWV